MKRPLQGAVIPRAPVPGATNAGEDAVMRLTVLTLTFCVVLATPAAAAVPHVVQPGETLWSIAAANNLTTRTVAAYNGLSEDAQVVLGSTINIPTTVEGYAALQQAGLVSSAPAS